MGSFDTKADAAEYIRGLEAKLRDVTTLVVGQPRTVSGLVDSTGAIISGAGFTVSSHPATGIYALLWDVPFSEAPALTVTVADLGASDNAYGVATTTGATVHIKVPGVAFHDIDFSIVARGAA